MKFTMTKPCDNCPFLKEGGIKLHRGRIKDIGGMMLNSQGGTFPCHKSVDYSESDEPSMRKPGEVHCAGALIFAEKHQTATQMMRISERCGGYDHKKLDAGSFAKVWDSLSQWMRRGTDKPTAKRRVKS